MGRISEILIQKVYEVYTKLCSKNIYYTSLKISSIPNDSVYAENRNKNYNASVQLVGRIKILPTDEERAEQQVHYDATVDIPTMSLIKANLYTSDFPVTFMKGKFIYKNVGYEIIKYETLDSVQDEIALYRFNCRCII